MRRHWKLVALAAALAGCDLANDVTAQNAFTSTPVATFREPWAFAFLPDGRLLVTEKRGALKLRSIESGQTVDVSGVPAVEYGGQGGLGDVVLHPEFASNGLVYLSYAEAGERGTAGAAVARARLVQTGDSSQRSMGAATTGIASRSGPTDSSISAPASARSSRRRKTCSRISARSSG
jgi:glucose/arabinose dehydrogenase